MSDTFEHYEHAVARFYDLYGRLYAKQFPVKNLNDHAQLNVSHMVKMGKLAEGMDIAKTTQVVTSYVNELYGDGESEDLDEAFGEENKKEKESMAEEQGSYNPPHHTEAEIVSFTSILLETPDDGWAQIEWTFRGTTSKEVVGKWDILFAMDGVKPAKVIDGFGDTQTTQPSQPPQQQYTDPGPYQQQPPPPQQPPYQQQGGQQQQQQGGEAQEREKVYTALHYEVKGDSGVFRPYAWYEKEGALKPQGFIYEGNSNEYTQLRQIVGDEFLGSLRAIPGRMTYLPPDKTFKGFYHLHPQQNFTVWHRLIVSPTAN